MSLNVLVVDNSAVMRSVLIRTVRLSGLPVTQVLQATNGAEALSVLAAHDIDLALIDVDAALADGGGLIGDIQADARLNGVAIVVTTPHGVEPRLAPAKGRALSIVQKPFTPDQIRATALRLLAARET